MFSLKVAQDLWLHFCRKKIEKIRLYGFFVEFLQKRDFRVFSIFNPLYLKTETRYRVHGFVIS